MPHTYSRILIHLIFSTRNRDPLLTTDIRHRLHAYIAGVIRRSDGEALAVNGTVDHVHVLMILPLTRTISELVRLIKSNSSKWLNENHPRTNFGWQRGYAAFSVSESISAKVQKYISGQEEHHRKTPFQKEYTGFLRKHGVQISSPGSRPGLRSVALRA